MARRTVIITGTNGKGSVAATLSAALKAAGVRAGLYTSPHLISVRERVRLGERDLTWAEFDALGARVLEVIDRTGTPASFFEALTAVAFLAMAEADVEVQVLEVGVGGARDATRAAEPTHVAVTQIALDHAALIGPTLADIAKEKLGVCAPKSLNVFAIPPRFARGAPPGWHLGKEVQFDVGSRLRVQTPDADLELPLPRLAGAHQLRNAALAAALSVRLGLDEAAIGAGMEQIRWRARLERLPGSPETWLDGAHNPVGVAALIRALPTIGLAPGFTLVFGAHPKKDAGPMLRRLAELAGEVVLTSAPLLRAARTLVGALPGRRGVSVVEDPAEAVARARSLGEPVLIAGSLYLAGAILAGLEGSN